LTWEGVLKHADESTYDWYEQNLQITALVRKQQQAIEKQDWAEVEKLNHELLAKSEEIGNEKHDDWKRDMGQRKDLQ
jgi:hypothetical protein